MAKFPDSPGSQALQAINPAIKTLPAGTALARIYFAGGPHPTRWDEFRHFGPTNARFDHHLLNRKGEPQVQDRSILYCARSGATCLAEVYQETRGIDRARNAPWLAVFALVREVKLLDLTGKYPTRAVASMAINSGSRLRARGWARDFYTAYPALQGIYYGSAMDGNRPAVAVTDRAESARLLPQYPRFNRALADDALLDMLKHAARDLGYRLR